MHGAEPVYRLEKEAVELIQDPGRRLGTCNDPSSAEMNRIESWSRLGEGFEAQAIQAWGGSKQTLDDERPNRDSIRRDSVRGKGMSARSAYSSRSARSKLTKGAGQASSKKATARAIAGETTAAATTASRKVGTSTSLTTVSATSRTSPHVNLHISRIRASSERTWDNLPVRTDLYSGFVPPTGEGQAEKKLIRFMQGTLQIRDGVSAASPLRSRSPLLSRSGQQWRAGTRAIAHRPLVIREQPGLDSPISSIRAQLSVGCAVYIIAQKALYGDNKGVVRAQIVDDLRLSAPILGWVSMSKKKEVLLQPASPSAAPVNLRSEDEKRALAASLEKRHRTRQRAWRLVCTAANNDSRWRPSTTKSAPSGDDDQRLVTWGRGPGWVGGGGLVLYQYGGKEKGRPPAIDSAEVLRVP